jgi:hypothetical protein
MLAQEQLSCTGTEHYVTVLILKKKAGRNLSKKNLGIFLWQGSDYIPSF